MGKLTLPVAAAVIVCGGGSCALAQGGLDSEVRQLKAQLASQQEQIDALRRLVEAQGRMLAGAPPAAASEPSRAQANVRAPAEAREVPKPATSLQLGGISFTPTGFLEYSQVWRSRTVSSGLPTNFASIPFNNTVEGNRKQTLGTAAGTRFGVQVNTNAFGVRLLGIVEADFLGYQAGNISTTTSSYGMRLRLAFVDVQKGSWEFLGGQDWSLLTPGRKGIAPTPSGLMLTQDLDPNNQSGLVWARSPQARVVYKASDQIAFGASFESGEPYAGGSGGAGAVTLPSELAPNYFNQVDTGSGGLAVPNPHLDFVAKAAFDPKKLGRGTHIEAGGLVTRPSFYNPIHATRFAATGGGFSLNASTDITGRLTLFTNNFYGQGGGRMIFGEAPALVIAGDGAPSLVRSMSMVQGLELQAASKLKFWAYYGGTHIDNTVATDPANGQPVGYGYSGSPGSHNRTIQEVTGGFTHVFWRDPNYGALQLSGQYSWVVRHPWFVAPGQPGSANLNMLYLGIRYVLPSAPGK